MLGRNAFKYWSSFPFQHSWMGFVADHERLAFGSRVLLRIVHLHRRMISGRAKAMPFAQVRRVNVSTRIDDEGRAAGRDFNGERVVVSMRAAAIHSVAAGVEKQIQIAITKDVNTRIRESLRLRGLSSW